ncbi:MAG TPA: hypothetical protein VF622_15530 [Segetibacter sp.]|jgi:hypothetical protein
MTKRGYRTLTAIILLLITVGIVGWFYLNKPNRTVTNQTGIEVTAAQLVKDYQANEAEANAKYLDKVVQVTGTVSEVSNNQDGKVTVMLSSEDPMSGVFCTLKDEANLTVGFSVTIKGFCSGLLSDVRIREAVIVR